MRTSHTQQTFWNFRILRKRNQTTKYQQKNTNTTLFDIIIGILKKDQLDLHSIQGTILFDTFLPLLCTINL